MAAGERSESRWTVRRLSAGFAISRDVVMVKVYISSTYTTLIAG